MLRSSMLRLSILCSSMLLLKPHELTKPMSARVRHALLFALVVLLASTGFSKVADASVFSEGPVVLVLKLVSATRVQPTTGVVVSADGLVMVSAEFISDGDEIVVMDGGTDISTYARPAKLVRRDDASQLALISVDGLGRAPILQSRLLSPADGDLHLAAFPPAEQIAQGAAPLWLPVDVLPAAGRNQWRVTNADSLPYVSGLILDNCGFLAGVSLASGAQSLTTGQATSIIGAPLLKALANLEVKLVAAHCDTSSFSERQADPLATAGTAALASSEPVATMEKMPRVIDGRNAARQGQAAVADDELASASGNDSLNTDPVTELPLQSTDQQSAPSVWALIPWWLWVLIAVLLAAVIFKLGTLWRLVNRSADTSSASLPRQAPLVEPPTTELLRGSSARTAHGLAEHASAEDEMPDITQLPEGFNAIVCVTGKSGDQSRFSRYCMADKAHIDLIIGRGDADISIESPSVSRQHARLKGTISALTISDLNSNNGTFIGAVPCLPGEIMFIGPTDEITLGDARFTITVKYKLGQLS